MNIVKYSILIFSKDSKKYVFYSVAILIFFEILILIVLDNENPYLYFEFVENFVHCLKQNNEPSQSNKY